MSSRNVLPASLALIRQAGEEEFWLAAAILRF